MHRVWMKKSCLVNSGFHNSTYGQAVLILLQLSRDVFLMQLLISLTPDTQRNFMVGYTCSRPEFAELSICVPVTHA